MRCPRCTFDNEPLRGRCLRCGYPLTAPSTQSSSFTAQSRPLTSQPGFSPSSEGTHRSIQPLMRGDALQKGRYRLVEPLALPLNQQTHGKAWSAVDLSSQQRPVIIREALFPAEVAREHPDKEQWLRTIAQRLASVGHVSNLPKVVDVFSEKGSLFIVFLRPEGVTLSSVLAQQGGALAERVVADYGWQVCDMLAELAALQPPLIHGGIAPETIIIDPGGSDVSLIHLPLFPLEEPQSSANKPSSAYSAPEQARHAASPSSDLYSLAAIMHHALTGYDPRERIAFFYPPVRRLNPAVSPRMEAILARQLHLSVEQRYLSPSVMRQDLAQLIDSLARTETQSNAEAPALPIVNPTPLSPEEAQEQRRSTIQLDIGVMLAIGILVIMVILLVLLRP